VPRGTLIRDAYLAACRTELRALKPGNVHDYAAGHGMSVADFEASAVASAPSLAAPGLAVGARILEAVRRTREATGCNTNLGILLLAAPLAAAGLQAAPGALRPALEATLAGLDRADAEAAFTAIRLANPGGLGDSPRHDVREPALIDLRQAMIEARGRDRIAEQYAGGFADVFDLGLPMLRRALARWEDEAWAAAATHLMFLGRYPDSHVARKHGGKAAEALRRRAAPLAERLLAADRPASLAATLLGFDAELKSQGLNPGTTADLTVATLFAHHLEAVLARA
jgi:triphosphoribosyl-dephospho-CoA synthase